MKYWLAVFLGLVFALVFLSVFTHVFEDRVSAFGAAQRQGSEPAADAVKLGDYLVEPARPNRACGVDRHGRAVQLTRRIFYKNRLVTAASFDSFVSPWNPSRLVFFVSPSCGATEEETGAFYFGGSRDIPLHLGVVMAVDAKELPTALWSPDDKFFALAGIEGIELILLNLQTAKTTNLKERFYNHRSLMSSVRFREWSATGKRLALVVSSTLSGPNGSMLDESDLLSVDPVTVQATYVATMRREDGWQKGEFVWVKRADAFELAVSPKLNKSAAIFVKKSP